MIKGRKRMFDDRYGVAVDSFLDYLQSASLTYKGSYTLFNSFASPEKYRVELSRMYDRAKDEVEVTIAETQNKFQKLVLIGEISTEIYSALALLSINADGNFIHKNFPGMESEGKTINEADFHNFYYWTNHFLEKMSYHLQELKESVGVTSQDNFVVPYFMMPHENASTVAKPLEYLKHLLAGNGIAEIEQSFSHPNHGHQGVDYEYDSETKTMTYNIFDSETGKWIESKRLFEDYYVDHLQKEFTLSTKLIDENIGISKDEQSIALFLKRTRIQLTELSEAIKTNVEAAKYPENTEAIDALIALVDKRALVYGGQISAESKSNNNSFKINAGYSKKGKATTLFNDLVKLDYMAEDSKNDFINAFTGSPPANKINWIGKKGDLMKLIKYADSKGVIEKVRYKWKVVANIFTLKGLDIDIKSMKNGKPTKNEHAIEVMVNDLMD